MKSGAADTFLFNTLYQMGVIFNEWNPTNDFFSMFCGDDSILYDSYFSDIDLSLQKFSLDYNLEVKRLPFESAYFAGKFLVFDRDQIIMYPDPIKLLMSLARTDIPNFEMLREIQTSMTDLFSIPLTAGTRYQLSNAIRERYKYPFDVTYFLNMIPDIVRQFSSLFYLEDGVVLDTNTRFKL
jgi:hypothetical protein